MPFEAGEMMGGEHTVETDLTRCHHDFEDWDCFESSIVIFFRMMFYGCPEDRNTLVASLTE